MAKEIGVPEPNTEPKTDPHPSRRALGRVEPERPAPDEFDEQLGIETDNAIEWPQEGQPGQPGGNPN